MPFLCITSDDQFQRIAFTVGLSVREILDRTDVRVRSSCGGVGTCGLCAIRLIEGYGHEFTISELNKLTPQQREQGVRLSCQLRPTGDLKIAIDTPAAPSIWKSIAAHEYSPALDRLQPLAGTKQALHSYGVAVDLGTTQIRASLWDLKTGTRLAGRSGLNPQAVFGADVLTRVVKATESSELAGEMGGLALRAIAGLLLDIAARESVDLHDIDRLVLVGNTPMLSLLTGKNYELLIQPDYWTREVDCIPEDLTSLARAWGCKEEVQIEIARPMAGFVGSDLIAAIIASRLTAGPAASLLIDFGTNSEIALWDGKKLWITSAAGGPAFEGCGLSSGMPAEPGAVCRVAPRGDKPGYVVEVIGGCSPKGICGSGLVDIIACLLNSGQLKKNGRFPEDIEEQGYPVLSEDEGIYLTKRDVDLFQRAKAGIAAAAQCLIQRASLNINDLRRVCVCGAFGSYLNIANAQAVGLLPAIAAHRIELCGNMALSGCELLLFAPLPDSLLQSVKRCAELINMSNDMGFELQFINNLYLQAMQDG